MCIVFLCLADVNSACFSTSSLTEGAVRCWEDCDAIWQKINNNDGVAPTSATRFGAYCLESTDALTASGGADPLCRLCSAPNPDMSSAQWPRPSASVLPTDGGTQFFYLSDTRVYEYTFINNHNKELTVRTSATSKLSYATAPNQPDSKVIPAGKMATGFCYRGRFVWT